MISNGVMLLIAVVVAALVGIHYERSTGVLKVYLEARATLGKRRRAAMKEGRQLIVVMAMVLFVVILATKH